MIAAVGLAATGALAPSPAAALGQLTQLGRPTAACISAAVFEDTCAAGLDADFPIDMAITPDRKFAYLVTEKNGGTIVVLSRTTAGVLKPSGPGQAFPGLTHPKGVAITADGKSVYVVSSEGLNAFSRNATTGALTAIGCFNATGDDNCQVVPSLQQDEGFPARIAVSGDNKSVYVGTAGAVVAVFKRGTAGATTGALTFGGCVSDAGAFDCDAVRGLGPVTGLAVSPDKKTVYAAADATIAILKRNTTTGALTQSPGTAGCVDEGTSGTCLFSSMLFDEPYGLVVSPDNKSVYVSSRARGAVVGFTRNATTGALADNGCVSDTGNAGACTQVDGLDGAAALAISKDNKSVYVGALTANALVTLKRTTAAAGNGHLSAGGCRSDDGSGGCPSALGVFSPLAVTVTGDGKSVYVVDVAETRIGEFTRSTSGAATGTLTQPDTPPPGCFAFGGAGGLCTTDDLLGGSEGVAATKDGKSVYVAARSGALIAYARNTTSGRLTRQACVTPAFVAGCIADDRMTSPDSVAVTADNKAVVVASADNDTVVILDRATSGQLPLAHIACVSRTGGNGCAAAPSLDNPQQVAVSADSKSVYVTSAGTNSVTAFKRNTTTNQLTLNGCFSVFGDDGCMIAPTLANPRGVVVTADGKSVYVASIGDSAIQEFTRTPSTGALSPGSCVAEGGALGCAPTRGLLSVTGIAASPDNKSLYAASYGLNGIGAFSRNPNTGDLTQLPGAQGCFLEDVGDSCQLGRGLINAFSVTVSPDNKSVYLGTGGGIAVFSRQAAGAGTGALSQFSGTNACSAVDGVDGCARANGTLNVHGLVVSQNNKNVYAATSGSSGLAAFARSTTNP